MPNALMTRLKHKSGTTIDAVAEITQPFVYKVLPDLLGLPLAGREHMYAFGNMVWATMGPMNELFHEAMKDTGPVIEWADALLQAGKPGARTASACRCSWPRIAARSPRTKRSCWWASCCPPPRIPP